MTVKLAAMTLDQIKNMRSEIMAIVERHGGGDVRVFGSTARGDSTPASDVDLLVDLGPDRSLLDRSGLILDLESLLGTHVDAISSKALHPLIREQVLKEAALI